MILRRKSVFLRPLHKVGNLIFRPLARMTLKMHPPGPLFIRPKLMVCLNSPAWFFNHFSHLLFLLFNNHWNLFRVFLRIWGSFQGFFVLFLSLTILETREIYFRIVAMISLLPRENTLIRVLGKYWKTICSQHCWACSRPRIITSMKNYI